MKIAIQTLGGFNISFEDKSLSASSIRRSKTWTAMKYMIAHHKRPVSSEELIEMLWPDDECSDPSNSLNHIIYRLRKMLSDCSGDAQCIVFSQGMYSWNPDLEYCIDAYEFESILAEAGDADDNTDRRAELLRKAIALYCGEFLCGETSELWLLNFKNYYRRLFLGAVNDLADIFKQQAAFEDVIALYGKAMEIEPYEESLYARQIEVLILVGEYAHAKQQYKRIEKLLRKEFEAEPTAEFQGLWLEIVKAAGNRNADLNELKSHLDGCIKKSAILCGPETFKKMYSYHRYLDERVQLPAFLGMMSVRFVNSCEEGSEKLRMAMKTMRQIMLRSLRESDIVCQYSADRFVLMITGAEEKHKMAPFTRIQRLYEMENGNSGVSLSVEVTAVGDGRAKSLVAG